MCSLKTHYFCKEIVLYLYSTVHYSRAPVLDGMRTGWVYWKSGLNRNNIKKSAYDYFQM